MDLPNCFQSSPRGYHNCWKFEGRPVDKSQQNLLVADGPVTAVTEYEEDALRRKKDDANEIWSTFHMEKSPTRYGRRCLFTFNAGLHDLRPPLDSTCSNRMHTVGVAYAGAVCGKKYTTVSMITVWSIALTPRLPRGVRHRKAQKGAASRQHCARHPVMAVAASKAASTSVGRRRL